MAALFFWARSELHRPYRGWSGPSVTVEIEQGWGSERIVAELAEAGVLRDARVARAYLWWTARDRELHHGEYRFDAPIGAVEVLDRIRRGEVVLHAVTIPEGLTLDQTAQRFAEAGLGDRDAVERAFRDPAPIASFDPQAEDLEGYLFPETYHFPRGVRPEEIASTMTRMFLEVVGPDFAARAGVLGMTPREAVVLSSMIEKETGVHTERARISRVFHNRLALGMPMQCDPTVVYALTRDGKYRGALSTGDLQYPSDWNTYVVEGLPRGPIASPGRASLEAAIHPSDGDELYFVAAPGGGHRFSSNLDAHLRAVRAWRDYARSSR